MLPPRVLGPNERALVAEWLAAAGNIANAYISGRRSDDPALHQRVVIVSGPDERPSHLVHAPSGVRSWVLISLGPPQSFEQFDTLQAALNSIQRVLV
jgi:hypothetical protein